jgi:hypothetical protein
MRHCMLAAVSVLAVAGGIIVATAQQAGASQEFSVIAHSTNFEVVPAGGKATANPSQSFAPSIGDEFIIREDLIQNGVTIGYDNIICTDTFNNNGLCTAVFAINGKGDIHGTALIRDQFDPNTNGPTVFDGSIDGGTFAYAHATGSVHLTSLPNGDTQDNFMLG